MNSGEFADGMPSSIAATLRSSSYAWNKHISPTFHFLGLGRSGQKMIKAFQEFEVEGIYSFTMESGRQLKCKTPHTVKILVERDFHLTKKDSHLQDADAFYSHLLHLSHVGQHVVILASLGGLLSSELAYKAIDFFEKTKRPYTAICCIPYKIEGSSFQYAEAFQQRLQLLVPGNSICFVHAQNLPREIPGLLAKNMFKAVNDKVIQCWMQVSKN